MSEIDLDMARLATYLSVEFLPMQQDGGLWKGKKSAAVALHYLKKQEERIASLEDEVRNLQHEVFESGNP